MLAVPDRTAPRNEWLSRVAARFAPPVDSRSEKLEIISIGTTLVLIAVVAVLASFLGDEDYAGLTEAAAVMEALAAAAILMLVALRCGVRRDRIVDVTLFAVFGAFALITIASGGSRTGVLFLGSLLPLMAGILRGWKVAAVWLALVLVVGSVSLLLGVNHIELPLKPAAVVVPDVMPAAFVLFTSLASGFFALQGYLFSAEADEAVEQMRLRTVAEVQTAVAEKRTVVAQRRSSDLVVELDLLRALSGSLAHDFNNYLCAIRGNAELAALDAVDESDLGESLLEIQRSSDRAAEVVADLLVFGSQQAARLERVELRQLVQEAAESATKSISDRVRFELSDSSVGEPVWVKANEEQLKAAVASLIRNASESIGQSTGEVRVRVGVRKVHETELDQCRVTEMLAPGEFAYIEVRDSGRGIPVENQHRIFQPLFTTKEKGRGLGLVVVAESVDRHGGMVRVDHRKNGTLFELLLPAESLSDISQGSFRPAALSIEGLTVLVVDDESAVRRITTRMLENNGARVIEASSGFEAIELFRERQSQIDLVVLDLAMPGFGGEETLYALREICPELPVVLISGHATREFDHLHELGEVATLRKPFTLPALAAAVADLMHSES